jgi:thioredoxin-related protein
MRLLYTLIFLTISIFAQDLKWEESLDKAFERAKIENKNVMVMVKSPTCRWCIKMKKYTLGDNNISKRLENFILVKVDRDSLESKSVPYSKYLPTIYFMTPNKIVLERVVGYCGILDFNSWIDDVNAKEIK